MKNLSSNSRASIPFSQRTNIRRWSWGLLYGLLWVLLLVASIANAQVSERPGPGNTGPKTPEANMEVYSGPSEITEDGAIIERVIFNKAITISASNVTIRDFVSRHDDHHAFRTSGSARNFLIEDGLVEGMKSSAVYGSNFTARRLHVRDSGNDGFKPHSNYVIENCWIHHLGYIPGAHADGIQQREGSNGVLRGNYFDVVSGDAGYFNHIAIFLSTAAGPIDNVLIEENWINGGGISIQVHDKQRGFGPPTNVRIINNRFGRDATWNIWRIDGTAVTYGNVWDDTGELVPNQTGDGGTPEPPKELADAPEINPRGGSYVSPQTVSLSSKNSDSTIYYTLDGSRPDTNSTKYSQPITVDTTMSVLAIAAVPGLENSAVSVEDFEFPPFTSNESWRNIGIPKRTDEFSVSAEMSHSTASANSVIGMSERATEAYDALAVAVRFSEAGIIEARNGGAYTADKSVSYEAGKNYLVNIRVNVSAKTYSVNVVLPDGTTEVIASNYSFRPGTETAASLANIAFRNIGQSSQVLDIKVDDAPEPPSDIILGN